MTAAERLLSRLDRVKQTGPDRWITCCPAHEDKSPSLSIRQVDDRILIHCFAGCDSADVLTAVGLQFSDLYNRPLSNHRPPISKRRHVHAAQAALRHLSRDALIVEIAACMVASGETISESDQQQLADAVERIHRVRGIAA